MILGRCVCAGPDFRAAAFVTPYVLIMQHITVTVTTAFSNQGLLLSLSLSSKARDLYSLFLCLLRPGTRTLSFSVSSKARDSLTLSFSCSLPVFLSLSLYLCLSHSPCHSVLLTLFMFLFLSFFFSHSLSLFLFLSPSLSLSCSLSLSPSPVLSVYFFRGCVALLRGILDPLMAHVWDSGTMDTLEL